MSRDIFGCHSWEVPLAAGGSTDGADTLPLTGQPPQPRIIRCRVSTVRGCETLFTKASPPTITTQSCSLPTSP